MNGSLIKQLFTDGNSIQIEFRDERRIKRVYQTLINLVSDNQIKLFLPEDKPIPIHPGIKLSVSVYSAQKSDTCYFISEILDYRQEDPSSLTISMPEPVRTISRRKFFRCDVDLPFSYLDREKNEQKGTVTNLSACGLKVIVFSDKRLKPLQYLDCAITLPTIPDPLKFTAKIVRIEPAEKDFQKALALNFENITEKFQNDITKYLFQRQRELIQLGHIKVGRI